MAELAMIEHSFRLREDLRLSLSLPEDLTQREVDRITRFLRAIPLEPSPGEFCGVQIGGGIVVSADTPEELARAVSLLTPRRLVVEPEPHNEASCADEPQEGDVAGPETKSTPAPTVREAGARGGRARAERLTPEERSESARKAGEASARAWTPEARHARSELTRSHWTPEMRERASKKSREVWAERRERPPAEKKPPISPSAPRDERRKLAAGIFTPAPQPAKRHPNQHPPTIEPTTETPLQAASDGPQLPACITCSKRTELDRDGHCASCVEEKKRMREIRARREASASESQPVSVWSGKGALSADVERSGGGGRS
jgi:hypothetical protein